MSEPDSTKDPRASARGPSQLPKRFYAHAAVEPEAGRFILKLDGRPARTPARHVLAVPSRALGEAIATEWEGQAEIIDPSTMPVTRLANAALDGVAGRLHEVAGSIAAYARTDLLCYRAAEPPALVQRQAKLWDPIVRSVERRIGTRFVMSEGVMHVAQPETTLAALDAEIAGFEEPFRLAGLNLATTLTGSVLIALALAWHEIDEHAAWTAAHLDEDWNISQWGEDAEAAERRMSRRADFGAAVLALSGD
jgi:chaperone required for assembly of F1-ATPase